jgi:phytoene dehydrogenase-like protein
LGSDARANSEEIRRFSSRDAEVFPRYEALLERVAAALEPTLDAPPPQLPPRHPRDLIPWWLALRAALRLGRSLPRASQVLLGAARPLLEEFFESEPLRSTLATDAVIGAFAGPSTPGTGYVLFHHVMGTATGRRGVWAYVRGGMGALSEVLATAARRAGARIETDSSVERIRTRAGRVEGVVLDGGVEVDADVVISSVDPLRTLRQLDPVASLPESWRRGIESIDFRSPVVKLNLALSALPEFRLRDRDVAPLGATTHVGPTDLDGLDRAYLEAASGQVSSLPLVELTVPSLLDDTLAPAGRHVASIFAQYAPARPVDDPEWPTLRDQMRDRALSALEAVAPGFSVRIEHLEVLAAPDLEREIGLTGGNIFHGAMTPDRLLFMRPVPAWSRYATPIGGLYLAGSGTHPGGGVMGAAGRNAAGEVLSSLKGS